MGIAAKTPPGSRGAIGRCDSCSILLPLRQPAENEKPAQWICTGCGERYTGVLVKSLPREFAKNVRPAASAAVDVTPKQGALPKELPACPKQAEAAQPHPITIAFPDRPAIVCQQENVLSRAMDDHIMRAAALCLPPQRAPFADNLRNSGNRPYDQNWDRMIRDYVAQSTDKVNEQFASLKDGQAADLQVFRDITTDQLHQILEDKDAFACLSIRPHVGDYPSHHALQVGMLAISIGLAMGWDELTLAELRMGCLIHDAGMLRLKDPRYEKRAILPARDAAEIAEHAVVGLQGWESLTDEISERSLIVAYQIHERCNGSGYPRGYSKDRIHPMGRVAGLADVFVALLSPRPHRPGLVPYHAIKKIMQDTERGLFDKDAVRALLDTVSVFPVGSFVALDDGRVGRVIRPNTGRYDRPVIEAWHRGELAQTPAIVDLADETNIKIANSLARLDD